MRKLVTRLGKFALVLPALLIIPASFQQLAGADLDEEIGTATDKGIEYLLKAIEAKQTEQGEHDNQKMGKIALETYALVVAGLGVDHPTVRKNFETLSRISLDLTYSVACYAFALDAAISQLQNDAAMASPSQKFRDDPSIGAAYRPRLEASVNALVRLRQKPFPGGWNYGAGGNRFDNSNTQFAVLGLGVGLKRKVPIPAEVWKEVADHWIKYQKKDGPEVKERLEYYPEEEKGEGKRDRIVLVDKDGDKADKKKGSKEKDEKKRGGPTQVIPARPTPDYGPEALEYFARGWDYDGKQGETWNMTCAGLSSLILAEEALRGQIPADFQNQLNKSIRDGYGWVMRNWNPGGGGAWMYYGIYSLEKVADLGEVKKFGVTPGNKDSGHDWYQEAVRIILNAQREDGSWPGPNAVQTRWNTAFALLILNRATSLITQGRSTKGKMSLTGFLGKPPGGKEGTDERNWVYIQELEREFHIPTILRQVKQRPTPNLMRILEQALKNYPEENSGFLVWSLAGTLESARNKTVKEFLDSQLLRITGVKYDEVDQYKKWYKRWIDVMRIGKEMKDPDNILVTFYKNTSKSFPLKKKIIWATGRCRKEEAAPLLIEDLASVDQDVRQQAYETLSLLRLSTEPIPTFEAKAAPPTRDQQIAEIRGWYANRKPVTK